MSSDKQKEIYDQELHKALSKFSFPTTCHTCTLLEQVLADQEVDVSELYPGMKKDPFYEQTLTRVQNMKGNSMFR